MTLYCAWLQLLLPLLTTGNLLSPITVTPALYGSDMTLDCNFLPASMLNDQFLVVTWQHSQEGRGDMVVHSYYYEKDQLDLQDKVYRNRTQLFPEKFPQGNASLRLMDLRLEDGGLYTCTVNTQIGSTTSRIQLVIAAPYRDPHLILALLDQQQSSITLKVVTGGGYPEAKVWWTNQTGK
ncbi:CD276 antigen [Microcaecilia unicolor]|uniref:CD276 antigen-like n=1 Tax=Microcaecilia unicolor TaxID=1415580 RepID=A0A6P7YN41_9AMPH|nr:CD276 antigen-like [Microcaecilia unicolor]XP_030068728.1 CD276 antigen-like [Microcaecilia unicolor]XP_030068729.1 CD276 antigen-like [Microcaecilia unicolor]